MATDAPATNAHGDKIENARPVRKEAAAAPSGGPLVGAQVAAATLGTAGAVIGSVVPVVGTVIGSAIGVVIGAIGGGLAGRLITAVTDPTTEETHWREQLPGKAYFDPTYNFEHDYAAAYAFGYAMRCAFRALSFEDAEPELAARWPDLRGKSRLDWPQARGAVKDAWQRYEVLHSKRK